jgi:calcineurin-like phosphoesterase family protein
MSTYFISDLHLGHVNMAILKRGFSTIEDHDNFIIKNWNKVVNKRDKIFIVGDVTMEKKSSYYLLDQLHGFKSVVMGNHDRSQDVKELLNYVDNVSGIVKYEEFWVTHCPIHESELIGKVNIHGHNHDELIKLTNGEIDRRYFNVSCEQLNYAPISLGKIRYKLKYG